MFPPIFLTNPIVTKYQELKQTVLDNEQVQRILYTLATVLGVIVGVALFVKKAFLSWYQSGGKEQVLTITNRVAQFLIVTLTAVSDYCQKVLAVSDTDVPNVLVSQ